MKRFSVLAIGFAMLSPRVAAAQAVEPSPVGVFVQDLRAGKATSESVNQLFKGQNLAQGGNPRTNGTMAVWAIQVDKGSPVPRVATDYQPAGVAMTPVGDSGLYALSLAFQPEDGFRWHYVVGDKTLKAGQEEFHVADPDSREVPGVPKGKLTDMPKWSSRVFAGTTRDWWVYVPSQYTSDKPACVMIFQDGGGAKNYTPAIFDNLIAKGEIPVTIAIFINPGTKADGGSNRSFEYDTLSDQYSKFLLEEILPEVEKTYKLKQDSESRALGGISSGGICAFTAAWERPDKFSKVLSWVGSFTDIASGSTKKEGGHNYPPLIRKTDKKPIRVFLQDGSNDLDNEHGNWPLANQEMAKSLAYKQYDYQFVLGKGFHSDRHGRAIMPTSLKWLWRDVK